jgi:hypothetical protein
MSSSSAAANWSSAIEAEIDPAVVAQTFGGPDRLAEHPLDPRQFGDYRSVRHRPAARYTTSSCVGQHLRVGQERRAGQFHDGFGGIGPEGSPREHPAEEKQTADDRIENGPPRSSGSARASAGCACR